MSAKKLIIFAPHPDDETFGCGGVLAKRIHEGFEPIIVLVTDGRALFTFHGIDKNPLPQQVADARLDETIKALEILGCAKSSLVCLDIENEKLEAQQERAEKEIADLLTAHKPEEIYFTNIHEGHPEHRLTNTIVRAACARVSYSGRSYQYIVNLHYQTSLDKIPDETVRIDVSDYREKKRKAVNCFRYHLDIISPEQDAPFAESFDHYAQDEEVFFV